MGIRDFIEQRKADMRSKRLEDIETRKSRLKKLNVVKGELKERDDLRKAENEVRKEIRQLKTARFREVVGKVKSFSNKIKAYDDNIKKNGSPLKLGKNANKNA